MISEAIAAMKPGCILIRAQERLVGSDVNRCVRAAYFSRKLNGVESIPRRLQYGDISSNGRDRDNSNVRRAQRHDERDRVIGCGVGIDQKGPRHAGRITEDLTEDRSANPLGRGWRSTFTVRRFSV